MGAEVAGVPGGAPVEGPAAGSFGRWLRHEREIRGISIEWVGVRFKAPPARIRAIEEGQLPIAADPRGLALARALARTIGADPHEAAGRLAAASPGVAPRAPEPVVAGDDGRWARIALVAIAALVTGTAVAACLGRAPAPDELARPVLRPDYVSELAPVDPGASSQVESGAPLSETPASR